MRTCVYAWMCAYGCGLRVRVHVHQEKLVYLWMYVVVYVQYMAVLFVSVLSFDCGDDYQSFTTVFRLTEIPWLW
jgi:hypothetical protein